MKITRKSSNIMVPDTVVYEREAPEGFTKGTVFNAKGDFVARGNGAWGWGGHLAGPGDYDMTLTYYGDGTAVVAHQSGGVTVDTFNWYDRGSTLGDEPIGNYDIFWTQTNADTHVAVSSGVVSSGQASIGSSFTFTATSHYDPNPYVFNSYDAQGVWDISIVNYDTYNSISYEIDINSLHS